MTFATADLAFHGKLRNIRLDDLVVQRLMIPFVIAMCDALFNRLPERRLAKTDHSGQAFLPDGSPETFGKRV
jgi:hypothetical protein